MTEKTIDFKELRTVPRILIEADLKPIQGERFQPTGFPDLGAAVYERPDGKRMILVESAQSIANRLEATVLDESGIDITKDLEGLSYIGTTIADKGASVGRTTSLIEPHRINSPYIIGGKTLYEVSGKKDRIFKEIFEEKAEFKKGGQLNWKNIAAAFLFYDPNSLLHGSFINVIDGRFRIPRALSGFIEAEDIKEVVSGGVKNDVVDPKGEIQLKDQTAEEKKKYVYGNIPFHRIEYTAGRVVVYFNFDISLLEGYGLPDDAKELLIALGLYKIRRFLNQGLRLRTACDFVVNGDIRVVKPENFVIPEEDALLKIVKSRIQACISADLFATPPITELIAEAKKVAKNSKNDDETN